MKSPRWLVNALAVGGAAVLLATACGTQSSPGLDGIHVANGTSIIVTLVVNGSPGRQIEPGVVFIPRSQLPTLPWSIDGLTPGGRVAISLDVDPVDWTAAPGQSQVPVNGQSAWVSLSCGELEIWVGERPILPTLGPDATGGTHECVP